MGKEVIFYYDVVCPFAYMASRYIERLGQKTGANIQWRPVLLGKDGWMQYYPADVYAWGLCAPLMRLLFYVRHYEAFHDLAIPVLS